MFEQAVLNPPAVRPWAVTAGFACQLVVAAGVLAIPLMFPQLLPPAEMTSWLWTPTPPPAPLREAAVPRGRAAKPWNPHPLLWLGPAPIRESAPLIDAPPAEMTVEGGTGAGGNRLDLVLGTVLRAAAPTPPAVKQTASAPPKPEPAAPAPLRVSGPVQAARLIHRVEPAYPVLARQMRVSGTVELSGLIGADGRIRELRVVSGHPLLVGAALDAVRQWEYAPTLLNGKAMEVVTTITVVYRIL